MSVLWQQQPGLFRGYIVDVATACVFSVALIVGGRQRTVAPAWKTLNENGGPQLWGIVFAVIAASLIVALFLSGRMMMLALWLAATPYGLLGWWFFASALTEPSASFIGAILCFRAAIMHTSRADAYRAGPAA